MDPMDKPFRVDPAKRAEVMKALAELLAADDRVVFAYLHGSFLGDAGFHDIDVGVCLRAGEPSPTETALELAERLSKQVGYPVDVRPLNGAPLSFTFHVFQGARLTCRDEELLADLMEDTVRRYLDMEPLLRRATVEAFAR
jgi:uncharacterized protein